MKHRWGVLLLPFFLIIVNRCVSISGEFREKTSPASAMPTPVPPSATFTQPPPSPAILLVPTPYQTTESVEVPPAIEKVLRRYFDLRYELLSVSPLSEITLKAFQGLIASGEEAKEFLVLETAKLAVVRKWYELRRLRYKSYNYQLEYKKIVYDSVRGVATIYLVEKFTIICEADTGKTHPDRGALKHTVVLQKENGQWRIVKDIYWDVWWRNYRKPGRSAGEVLRIIQAILRELQAMPTPTPFLP